MKESIEPPLPLPRHLCLHELVEANAARTPEAIAVSSQKSRLTYRELCDRAGRLASHLQALGVGPEARVGLCLERSPELVVAALGVLKAGGAYLPLDPAHPAERLAYILEDSAVPVLITSRALAGTLPAGRAQLLWIDEAQTLPGLESVEPPRPPVPPESLAYVIYTSGSTGRPKGTELTRAGLHNVIAWYRQELGITPEDRAAQVASPAFDASIVEIWPALTAGAGLYIPPQELLTAPADLLAWMAAERITICFLPTPLAEACLALELPPGLALRVMFAAGDRLHRVARELPFRLLNQYGPTESTVATTSGEVATGPEGAAAPPIGRPIANLRVHLLGPDLEPVPAGEPGEIGITGIGLARGYLRRPELTAERFVPDPWAGDGPGSRMYRTGDLARELPSGELDFLGRIDHQVKIRGFRIELGEVEAALLGCAEVSQAVAVALPDGTGAPRLVAYAVPAPDRGSVRPDELRRQLRAVLPEAMVPAVFVFLESLPLSPNGKVDRRALPAPGSVPEAADREFVAPRTVTEAALAGIWSELLGGGRFGVEDSFLDAGGHSLLAAQLAARVRERLHVELPVRDVFENPVLGALASRIEEQAGAAAPACPIVPVPRSGELPLSFAQERIWFLQQLDSTIRSYQAQAKIRFRGRLHTGALERSLAEIVRRHEIFHTTFPTLGDRPVQRFHAAWPDRIVTLPVVDLSGLPEDAREAEAERVIAAECRRPFDVTCLPLVRWTLLQLGPAEHVWLHAEHHLVHDGWSFNRIVGELATLYAAFSRGESSPLPPLPLQFADWAAWQREWMRGPEAAAQIDFWKRQLANRPAVLKLSTDRPRPRRQSFAGRVERMEMPLPLCEALRAASRREGVSLFMLMQAAFAALLSRHSGQDQVNVGAFVANRRWREIEPVVGMIVDNLVLANDLSGDPVVRQLLERTRQLCLDAGANQDIPFDLVVEAAQPQRDLAYNPLFQASFNFHDSPLSELAFPGLQAELTEGLSNSSAKFDLNIICIPRKEAGITLLWEYATALFDRSTMQRMIGHFHTLLAGIAAGPGRRLPDLPLLTDAERQQLVQEWNDTATIWPEAFCLHELIAAQAARSPGRVAVVCEGRSLTCAELDAASGRLAAELVRLGVGPEVPVGICAERSLELVVGLLAILKSGGAYVPLDPTYPAERLAYMLDDSRAPVLLAHERLLDRLPDPLARVVVLLDGQAQVPPPGEEERSEREVGIPADPDNLVYIIYTSGSTGRPKGTMNSHRGVVNRLLWMQERFALTAADAVLQKTPLSFDISVWELFWPLLAGARLVLARPGGHRDPAYLVEEIAAHGITTIDFVPSMLQVFLETADTGRCGSLVRVASSGEALPAEVERRFYERMPPGVRLYNQYGPTEAAMEVTSWPCERESRRTAVPIGRPTANASLHVLDRDRQPVPAGVPGELHIGGVQVGRGYRGRPDLTAEIFVPSPFAWGERLYRTGDLSRHLAAGEIEFLGRIDHQVKIRGFRIEPGEIEAALRAHPAVCDAIVLVREDGAYEGGGALDRRLVAYVVLAEGGSPEDLPGFLATRLPAYMVPSAFVTLESLPLTPNGKVNRAALPAPGLPVGDGDGGLQPRTEVELLLQEIWSELTGVERVGIRADFFKIGGHSLLGARMLSRLRDELDVELPLSAVFERPTIEGLAAALEDLLLAEAEGLAAVRGEAL
jgi:amino acid adenylation domain-containing protein